MKRLTNPTLVALLSFSALLFLLAPSEAFAQDDDDDDGAMFEDDLGDTNPEPEPEPEPDPEPEEKTATASVEGGMASGTLGIGFNATTKGVRGIEAEYWLSEKLVAVGLGRLRVISEDTDGVDSVLNLQIGLGALYVMKARPKAALMIGARFLLGYFSAGESVTSIALEAPLRLQIRPHDKVAIHVEGGVAIDFGDQTGLNGDNLASFAFGVGTNNVFGNAGLTFYFD